MSVYRVNLDNPGWIPPTTRNDQRYEEDEEGTSVPGVKKSRFLKKSKKIELSFKEDSKKEELAPRVEAPSAVKEEVVKEVVKVEKKEKNSRGLSVIQFPPDPSDLPPLPEPPPKNVPDYYGWSHSDSADSWYLEAHTPSIHQQYESFYDEALKKKVISPKFYSCV